MIFYKKIISFFLYISSMLFCLCPQHPAREYDGSCQGDLKAGVRIPLGIAKCQRESMWQLQERSSHFKGWGKKIFSSVLVQWNIFFPFYSICFVGKGLISASLQMIFRDNKIKTQRVRSPKFIWAPYAHCTAVLIGWEPVTPSPPHLGSYTRALLVSETDDISFFTPCFQLSRPSLYDEEMGG